MFCTIVLICCYFVNILFSGESEIKYLPPTDIL